MLDPVKNFAVVTVSTGYDDTATSIALEAGHGARLPQPSTDGEFNVVWFNSTDYPNPSDDPNVEIGRVTARSTDTLTVTRAQEGTAASTKNTADKTYKMILTPTAKTITDIESNKLSKQMLENDALLLDATLSADGTYCAESAEQVTAGTALAFGEVAYYAVADSKWEKTDADAEATAGPVKIGIVVIAAAEDATATVMYKGKIREDDWNWATVGAPLYLDTATAGGMTLTAPSGTDDVVRVVGQVIDANQIWFDPDTSYITLA
jgi:hypothetical protein